jgi:hypothetical protein
METKRINKSNYIRPPKTFTDTIQSKEEILKYIEGYERIEEPDELIIGNEVRYITLDKDKKQVFRLGGKIVKIDPYYFVLNNGKISWSVQRYFWEEDSNDDADPTFETIFFRKKTPMIGGTVDNSELILLKERLNDKDKEIKDLKEQLSHVNDKLTGEITKIKQVLKRLITRQLENKSNTSFDLNSNISLNN